MKRFLIKVFCFSLPLLLAMGGVEIWLEHRPNVARDKHLWMKRHAAEVNTLILGHSHNFYALRPDLLGRGTYNLALPSQTYRYDLYLLTHYPMPRLRTVVLNYDYFQLWEDFESLPGESFQAMRYRIYMDCDIHPRLSWYGFEVLCPPLMRKKLFSPSEAEASHCDSLGWGTEYTLESRPDEWDNGRLRAEANTRKDSSIVVLNEGFLCRALEFCRQHHVRVVMLNTPTTLAFRQHEAPGQKERNARTLAALLQQYPEVSYLDYEADTSFTEHDFFDGDHLNQYGARKLTLRLRDIINDDACCSTP